MICLDTSVRDDIVNNAVFSISESVSMVTFKTWIAVIEIRGQASYKAYHSIRMFLICIEMLLAELDVSWVSQSWVHNMVMILSRYTSTRVSTGASKAQRSTVHLTMFHYVQLRLFWIWLKCFNCLLITLNTFRVIKNIEIERDVCHACLLCFAAESKWNHLLGTFSTQCIPWCCIYPSPMRPVALCWAWCWVNWHQSERNWTQIWDLSVLYLSHTPFRAAVEGTSRFRLCPISGSFCAQCWAAVPIDPTHPSSDSTVYCSTALGPPTLLISAFAISSCEDGIFGNLRPVSSDLAYKGSSKNYWTLRYLCCPLDAAPGPGHRQQRPRGHNFQPYQYAAQSQVHERHLNR